MDRVEWIGAIADEWSHTVRPEGTKDSLSFARFNRFFLHKLSSGKDSEQLESLWALNAGDASQLWKIAAPSLDRVYPKNR